MPMVNREEFLSQLEAVRPGIDLKGDVDQSSCFVFKGGKVITFSGEIACFHESCLKEVEGAINAAPLLEMLRQIKGENINVEMDAKSLKLQYKRERVKFKIESEIELPIDVIEDPGEYTKFPADFAEALALVQECASKDESRFDLTCIHIHPKFLEAAGQFQFARYRIDTGLEKSILVKKDHLTHIIGLGMTEYSLTQTWMHFRNPSGVVLSCQWTPFEDFEFPSQDITKYLKLKGTPTSMPKGLADAAKKANIFTAENVESDDVDLELRPGGVKIVGKSESGRYEKIAKIKYSGKPLSFTISPKILQELVKKHSECEVTDSILKIDGGKWKYGTCLGSREESK